MHDLGRIARLMSFAQPNGAPGPTVRDVVDAYLAEKRLQHQAGAYSAGSLERAVRYLESFAMAYGGQAVANCRGVLLTKWLLAHPEWVSPFTRADAAGSVVTCFRWAEREGGLIGRNPFCRPKHVGAAMRPREPITPEEYRALRQVLRRARTPGGKPCKVAVPLRALLSFLFQTGARTCEARESLWEELDWSAAVIVLARHKTAEATGELRRIPVRRVLPLLRWLYRHRKPGQRHIFTIACRGRPWTRNRLTQTFRRFAREAGLSEGKSAYCLRHGLAVQLLEAGVGERQVADVLGHRSTRYVAWYGRGTLEKADYLNRMLEGKKKQKH